MNKKCSREIAIIYHDEDIIVVNKPTLLLSVPGRGTDRNDSVLTRLQQQFDAVHVVHRLDWETSGIMIFARHKTALRALHRQFMNRQVKKFYDAIVFGKMHGQGMIDFPMMADWQRRPRQKVDYQQGKPSKTFWQALTTFQINCLNCTRLRLQAVTGRSHQLRVHLAALSHPILGDRLYAPPMVINLAQRLLLHACSISFVHPVRQQNMSFQIACDFGIPK